MKRQTLLAIALVGLVPLAGCLGFEDGIGDGDGDGENVAPDAALVAAPATTWNGERITIDATNSTDPDGEIVRWHLDFGDGTQVTVDNRSEAKVEHVYEEGGVYEVTVTVTDDGADHEGALSDTAATQVVVNERSPVGPAAVAATPLGNESSPNRYEQEFDVNEHADRFEANLTLESLLAVGASEVRVRVLDPSGQVVTSQNVTLSAGEASEIELSGALEDEGNHTLEVIADNGGAQFTGELRVYYDAPALDAVG